MAKIDKRRIVGKRIAAIEQSAFHNSRYGKLQWGIDALILEDGTRLFFGADEQEDDGPFAVAAIHDVKDQNPPQLPAVKLPRAVEEGIRTLLAHALAGTEDDLELDASEPEGRRAWRQIIEAAKYFSMPGYEENGGGQ